MIYVDTRYFFMQKYTHKYNYRRALVDQTAIAYPINMTSIITHIITHHNILKIIDS